jgi:hypothetical protein
MNSIDHLHLCPMHGAIVTAWFPFDRDLALSHVVRLWLDRNMSLYWRLINAGAMDAGLDENAAQDWLAENCYKVAKGCPICHDLHPAGLLSSASQATYATLAATHPYWRISVHVLRIERLQKGAAGYLARLTPVEIKQKRAEAVEPFWN